MQNAVKFKMQGELQKVLIRGNYAMPSNREENEPVVKKGAFRADAVRERQEGAPSGR